MDDRCAAIAMIFIFIISFTLGFACGCSSAQNTLNNNWRAALLDNPEWVQKQRLFEIKQRELKSALEKGQK